MRVTNAVGKPVAVEAPSLRFSMPAMGSMPAMRAEAQLAPTGKPGEFRGEVDLGMEGTWQAAISFKGPSDPEAGKFSVQAQ